MNLWIILAIVAVICLLNRAPSRAGRRGRGEPSRRRDVRDDQIDRLKARVATLEEILLDRDRRLRDDFRGI